MATTSDRLLLLCSISVAGFGCPTRTIYYDAGTDAGGAARGAGAGGFPGNQAVAGMGGVVSQTGGSTGSGGMVSVSGSGGAAGGGPGDDKQGNSFMGSPCIVNYDGAEIIYAHAVDQGIYSRNRINGVWSQWSKVQLDGSMVAPKSGIGCSEGNGDVYLVGLSASPMGEMLFAEGSSTQFGGFQHELGTETFSPLIASISSAAGQDRFYLVGAIDAGPQVWMVDGSTFTQLTPISTQTTPFVSAIDVALQPYDPVWLRIVVGFEKSGQLGIYDNVLNAGSGSWSSPVYIDPPANHVYAFSPAVCADGSGTHHDVHVAVVTEDGEVWDSFQTALSASSSFPPWELVGQDAASSVDCTIMPDSTVRIAALNANGRALEIQGSPGSWVQADLGTY